jgi:hypothetical protein
MLRLLPFGILFIATSIFAGPLDDMVGEVTGGDQLAWWVQLVALGTAVCSLAVAALPKGLPGDKWEKIRRVLNYIAMNWGNARNRDE